MLLTKFSVNNYRNIKKAELTIQNKKTVLLGKNNAGKSNILSALNDAISIIIAPAPIRRIAGRRIWQDNLPQEINANSKSAIHFRVIFELQSEAELVDFHMATNTTGQTRNLPLDITIKPHETTINIAKQGGIQYKENTSLILEYIAEHISFQMISAVRLDTTINDMLNRTITERLHQSLSEQKRYQNAMTTVMEYENKALQEIEKDIAKTLSVFFNSQVKSVAIRQRDRQRQVLKRYDVSIDDGVDTPIQKKGDGAKNLLSMGLLSSHGSEKDASIVAIDEPEAHLHPGAIHEIATVLDSIAEGRQVIIATHSPIFVSRAKVHDHIIVEAGEARSARSISEIRNELGIAISDNLEAAECVLITEGDNDKKCLQYLFETLSQALREAINNGRLVIVPLNGSKKLVQHLLNTIGSYNSNLCKCFVLLDDDKSGREAEKHVLEQNYLSKRSIFKTIHKNQKNDAESEFEDWINIDIYLAQIQEKLTRDGISTPANKVLKTKNIKWSAKFKECYYSRFGRYDNKDKNGLKQIVHQAIMEYPDVNQIIRQERVPVFYELIAALECALE